MNRRFAKFAVAVAVVAPLAMVSAALPGGVASAKAAADNPTSCVFDTSASNGGITLTIDPPLSVQGTPSTKGGTGTSTVDATYSCAATSTTAAQTVSQSFTVTTDAAKPKKGSPAVEAGDSTKDYYLSICGSFAASATKELGKAANNLAIAGGKLTKVKASNITNSSTDEVGFGITGTVVSGTYPTAKGGASIDNYFLNDSNNSNLESGCSSGPVTNVDIDTASSTATI